MSADTCEWMVDELVAIFKCGAKVYAQIVPFVVSIEVDGKKLEFVQYIDPSLDHCPGCSCSPGIHMSTCPIEYPETNRAQVEAPQSAGGAPVEDKPAGHATSDEPPDEPRIEAPRRASPPVQHEAPLAPESLPTLGAPWANRKEGFFGGLMALLSLGVLLTLVYQVVMLPANGVEAALGWKTGLQEELQSARQDVLSASQHLEAMEAQLAEARSGPPDGDTFRQMAELADERVEAEARLVRRKAALESLSKLKSPPEWWETGVRSLPVSAPALFFLWVWWMTWRGRRRRGSGSINAR